MKKDYYQVLGIEPSASPAEIKKAFRNLSLKYHPDHNPNDKSCEEKFKEINEAYQTLGDSGKKAKYDSPSHNQAPGIDLNDFFNQMNIDFGFPDMFSGHSKKSGMYVQKINLNVPFKDALFGSEQTVDITYSKACSACNGTGGKRQKCNPCQGTGRVIRMMGTMQFVSGCDSCGGEGQAIIEKCLACNGSQILSATKKISIKIPAGINDGNILQFKTNDSDIPEVHAKVHVLPHSNFKKDGLNVYSKIKISCLEAMIGGYIEVESIHGMQKVCLPAGIQPEQRLKLSGLGGQNGSIKGDHLLDISVYIPKIDQADLAEKINLLKKEIEKEKK